MANVTLNVTDNQGKATGTVDAPAEIFGFSAEEVQSRIPLIHQVVIAQLAAARQAPTPPRLVAWFPAVAASRGSRRAPVVLVRAPSVHRSGTTAAPCSVRSRVTTPSAPRRR